MKRPDKSTEPTAVGAVRSVVVVHVASWRCLCFLRWVALRTVILLAFLLLAGCHRQSVQSVRVVADATGTKF